MQISLNLPERIGALILLGEVTNAKRNVMNLISDTRKVIDIRKEEIMEYQITPRREGGLDWDKEKAELAKDFTISEEGFNFLKTRIKQHDEGTMHKDLVPFANKVLGEPTEPVNGEEAANQIAGK